MGRPDKVSEMKAKAVELAEQAKHLTEKASGGEGIADDKFDEVSDKLDNN